MRLKKKIEKSLPQKSDVSFDQVNQKIDYSLYTKKAGVKKPLITRKAILISSVILLVVGLGGLTGYLIVLNNERGKVSGSSFVNYDPGTYVLDSAYADSDFVFKGTSRLSVAKSSPETESFKVQDEGETRYFAFSDSNIHSFVFSYLFEEGKIKISLTKNSSAFYCYMSQDKTDGKTVKVNLDFRHSDESAYFKIYFSI